MSHVDYNKKIPCRHCKHFSSTHRLIANETYIGGKRTYCNSPKEDKYDIFLGDHFLAPKYCGCDHFDPLTNLEYLEELTNGK